MRRKEVLSPGRTCVTIAEEGRYRTPLMRAFENLGRTKEGLIERIG